MSKPPPDPSGPAAAALEIRGLAVRLRQFMLGPLDLDLAGGELLALLGPSGSGKTTLLETVAGFHTPSAGRIRLGDRDITRLPPERRRLALVVQDYALFPHLTVAQNVAFGLRYQHLPAKRVDEALVALHIAALAGRRPQQLSGGERQRVALARALVTDPAAFLLDEPLAALDAATRQGVRADLKQFLSGVPAACLLVTHDQLDALALADTLAVIAAGRIQQIGAAQEVYRRPRTAWVAQFLGLEILRPQHRGAAAGSAGGMMRTAAGPACPAATLSVRPEDVQVFAGRRDGANTLQGTLAGWSTEGPLTRVRVNLSAGGQLAALLSRRELDQLAPSAGLPVTCAIDPQDLWPVEDAPPPR